LRNTNRIDNDAQNSPLDALFEMTKKTFDKSDMSKSFYSKSTINIKSKIHQPKIRLIY
jgi:hypothetical protein